MAVNNSLAKKNQKASLSAYLTNDAVKNQINSIVGGKNGQRFIASIVSAVGYTSPQRMRQGLDCIQRTPGRELEAFTKPTARPLLHGAIQRQQARM